jgi:hypothetical protein
MSRQIDPALWGPHAGHYAERRPRRILALDGGGIRGLATLPVLARLESLLAVHYGAGPEFRLAQFFDYVGGTSTGAIIAAAIARGRSVAEVLDFYRDFGASVFDARPWYAKWKSLYENGPLETQLRSVFAVGGDEMAGLQPESLETLLLVVTRNASTDSAWPVSSNPAAKYNDPSRKDCNLRVPLWKLVRASTAAPVYFSPETIEWDSSDAAKTFQFVDGGTTPYNNPAFLLYRMATEPQYRLAWERGERNLLVVSLGTGSAPFAPSIATSTGNVVTGAANTLLALMSQAAFDQDMACRTIGRCAHGPHLDREIEDLVPREAGGQRIPLSTDLGRSFLYLRYDASLSRKWLDDRGLADVDPGAVSKLDSVAAMPDLERVGAAVAREIDLTDLGPFIDVPLRRKA